MVDQCRSGRRTIGPQHTILLWSPLKTPESPGLLPRFLPWLLGGLPAAGPGAGVPAGPAGERETGAGPAPEATRPQGETSGGEGANKMGHIVGERAGNLLYCNNLDVKRHRLCDLSTDWIIE